MPAVDPRDVCVKCGYSLHTLDSSANCPECGTPVKQSRETPRIKRLHQRFIQRVPGGWKSIIASAIALFVLTVAYISFARGLLTIEEFSPETFQYRARSWYAIPWVEWRISSEQVSLRDTHLGKYLRQHRFLSATVTALSWYPISLIQDGERRWLDQGAMIDYAVENDSGAFIHWSDKNQQKAAMIWPVAIKLVQIDAKSAAVLYQFLMNATTSDRVNTEHPEELQQWVEEYKRLLQRKP